MENGNRERLPLSLRLTFAPLLAALLILIGLRVLNHASVFPPVPMDRDMGPALAAQRADVREVRFAADDGTGLYGWVMGREDAPLKILFAGGNGEYVGPFADEHAARCRALDARVLLFDYRGYGNSEGSPSEAGIYSDARGAYRFALAELGWRPADIVLWGRSLGGAPTTHLAAALLQDERPPALAEGAPPRAVILEATFTSAAGMARAMMPFLIRPDWLCYCSLDNLGRAAGLTVPVFIYHGTADEIVPFAHGQALYDALPGRRRLLPLEGVRHNGIWHNAQRAAAIYEELRAFLKGTP
jgi:uncharacterized protein